MTVHFTKMNGAGNDFVLIDNRDEKLRLSRDEIVRLCHRQRGVGADGLFLLKPSANGHADWAWEFYNSDGSTADMCGNGARCFARFARKVAGTTDGLTFETGAGVIRATFDGNLVTVGLTDPKSAAYHQQIDLPDSTVLVHSIDTGVPHVVMFVDDADKAMVQELGAKIRYHEDFAPQGTNVNFVQKLGGDRIRVRTYERGVEGETLACGTGVTASALVSAQLFGFGSPVKVQVQGGDTLEVSFQRDGDKFSNVQLKGPAEFVFEGKIEI